MRDLKILCSVRELFCLRDFSSSSHQMAQRVCVIFHILIFMVSVCFRPPGTFSFSDSSEYRATSSTASTFELLGEQTKPDLPFRHHEFLLPPKMFWRPSSRETYSSSSSVSATSRKTNRQCVYPKLHKTGCGCDLESCSRERQSFCFRKRAGPFFGIGTSDSRGSSTGSTP